MFEDANQFQVHPTNASNKRSRSFWDPIYDPVEGEKIRKSNWDFERITGVNHCLYEAGDLLEYISAKKIERFTLRNKKFDSCDFRGEFKGEKQITFSKCDFEKCDFGSAAWYGVKFSECSFTKCSFTLARFDECQFRECFWREIGISGSETRFANTAITNPEAFIKSASTKVDNLELLSQKNTNKSFQLMRLEESKTKLAKTILNSLDGVGDDASYYNAVKAYSNQKINEKLGKAKHEIFSNKNIYKNRALEFMYGVERLVVNISGSINDWGNNVARPIVIGAFLIVFFAILYYVLKMASDLGTSFMMSFDVTFLFGYTKHANNGLRITSQVVYAINAFLGLWWYAVLVPTVINRISRIRS